VDGEVAPSPDGPTGAARRDGRAGDGAVPRGPRAGVAELRLPTIVGPVGLPFRAGPRTAAAPADGADRVRRIYLRPCLLLLLAEGPSHGYELFEQVAQFGIRGTNPGGIYRSLRGMEQENLVTSWWEPSQAGPARRTYALTSAGRVALDRSIASLREVHQLVGNVLDRYDQLPTSSGRRRP
jgi:PadR family transcriptional regulator PadR